MSGYNEFKQDVKQKAVSFGIATIIVWLFNALVVILTLGMMSLFSKSREIKSRNENYNNI
jgi:hypothetical protein